MIYMRTNYDRGLFIPTQVDVWAVGVLAYELLEGHCPFEHETRQGTYHEIMRAAPRFPSWMSADAVNFIRYALDKVILAHER